MKINYEIPTERLAEYELMDKYATQTGKTGGLVDKLHDAISKLPEGWITADKVILEYFGNSLAQEGQRVRISPADKELTLKLPSGIPASREQHSKENPEGSVSTPPSNVPMQIEKWNKSSYDIIFINFEYDGTKYVVASRKNTSLV